MLVANLQTAFPSPPGATPFYLKGVASKHVIPNRIHAGMMPFTAIQVLAVLFPASGLWLPEVLYR